jgi:RES domain-containing protein
VAFQPDPRIAEALARLATIGAPNEAWKHTFVGQSPVAPNTRGARWNPRDVPAVYLAFTRDTAMAEGRHLVAQQPQPIRRGRTLSRVAIAGLQNVLDLRDRKILKNLGVGDAELAAPDFAACQLVGGTAEWLGHGGIIVPSARIEGFNLVIFERKAGDQLTLVPVESEPIDRP